MASTPAGPTSSAPATARSGPAASAAGPWSIERVASPGRPSIRASRSTTPAPTTTPPTRSSRAGRCKS